MPECNFLRDVTHFIITSITLLMHENTRRQKPPKPCACHVNWRMSPEILFNLPSISPALPNGSVSLPDLSSNIERASLNLTNLPRQAGTLGNVFSRKNYDNSTEAHKQIFIGPVSLVVQATQSFVPQLLTMKLFFTKTLASQKYWPCKKRCHIRKTGASRSSSAVDRCIFQIARGLTSKVASGSGWYLCLKFLEKVGTVSSWNLVQKISVACMLFSIRLIPSTSHNVIGPV